MNIITSHIFLLINLLLFLLLSAFFSGTETAFFSLTRYQLQELNHEESTSSKLVVLLLKNPSKLLISILLGNMTVNIFFFCLSAVFISKLSAVYHGAYTQILFGILMLIAIIVFGEILPKAFGIKMPVKIACIACYPIYFWEKISTPLRLIVTLISSKFEPKVNPNEIKIKPEELRMLLKLTKEKGEIVNETEEIIEDIITLSSLKIKHIMTPRVDVVQCSKNITIEKAAELAGKNKVLYLPVYDKSKDNPIGYVLTKDIIFEKGNKNRTLVNYIREPVFAPETKKSSELLTEMINRKFKMAFVVDEYGGLSGKVTIDDILEEILGDFFKVNYDKNLVPVEKLEENIYRIQAGFSLNDWGDIFDYPLDLSNAYNVSSVGGFLTCLLGRLPALGDSIEYKNLKFTVETMVNRRLKSIILEINK